MRLGINSTIPQHRYPPLSLSLSLSLVSHSFPPLYPIAPPRPGTSLDLGSDGAAKKIFKKIDDNGGGIVLMDEWCEYIKSQEQKSKTLMGEQLGSEE